MINFFFFEEKNICIQSWRVELEQTCSKYIFEAAITSNVLLLYKSFLNKYSWSEIWNCNGHRHQRERETGNEKSVVWLVIGDF